MGRYQPVKKMGSHARHVTQSTDNAECEINSHCSVGECAWCVCRVYALTFVGLNVRGL